jgi:hypothetical protein
MEQGNMGLREFFGLDGEEGVPDRGDRADQWEQRIRAGGYDVTAPDGSIWELSHGEWRSRSHPGACYDTEDLAYYFASIEKYNA